MLSLWILQSLKNVEHNLLLTSHCLIFLLPHFSSVYIPYTQISLKQIFIFGWSYKSYSKCFIWKNIITLLNQHVAQKILTSSKIDTMKINIFNIGTHSALYLTRVVQKVQGLTRDGTNTSNDNIHTYMSYTWQYISVIC